MFIKWLLKDFKYIINTMVNLEELIEPLYSYNAYVVGIYDGDTITCDIDVGFGLKNI